MAKCQDRKYDYIAVNVGPKYTEFNQLTSAVIMETGRRLIYVQTSYWPIWKEEADTSDLGASGDLRNVALAWYLG